MEKQFYSNGKLLITGEYVVLDGAKAFALPTKFGQYLHVQNHSTKEIITWKSYDNDGSVWFETDLSFDDIINEVKFENDKIKSTLVEILHHAYLLNPNFLQSDKGYQIETKLTFPKNWGLGTSSTLINNIAQWLEIDAFKLLKNSFGGSGYDIACAQHNEAILYQLVNDKPTVETFKFNPEFTEYLYFVYLNQKQNSKEAIKNYLNQHGNIHNQIPTFNNLTETIAITTDFEVFSNALHLHEIELSNILETQTVQEALFHDFDGFVKSLGAWGGDFVMVASKKNPSDYFISKGFTIVLSYEEMILE